MNTIIDAIYNLVTNPVTELSLNTQLANRANSRGVALEEYIKDLFAGTINETDENKRLDAYYKTFSYLGNDANPPDIMLKNGDAIEVKKIESVNSALALNSSYPKQKLKHDSPMISQACREAEKWDEKDMIYCVGTVQKGTLRHLCMVYGMDYCASTETYEKVKKTIKIGVESIPNIAFSQTKELGKVNKIDPLGITYLRIRGMWGIENPFKVFSYIFNRDLEKEFNFMVIINEEKYKSFENTKKIENLANSLDNFYITDVKIKNPDNPAKLKKAKLISFVM